MAKEYNNSILTRDCPNYTSGCDSETSDMVYDPIAGMVVCQECGYSELE